LIFFEECWRVFVGWFTLVFQSALDSDRGWLFVIQWVLSMKRDTGTYQNWSIAAKSVMMLMRCARWW
jgi:hypothetical protein